MASGGIDILLTAKDAVSTVIQNVGDRIKNFGSSIGNAFKTGIDVLAKLKYLIGDVVKDALTAYSKQEAAERSLIAAHKAFGEAGEQMIGTERAIASAIQDETGVGDENTLARMAALKMLGVQTDKLEEAARAMVALTGMGMAEEAAERALAQAYNGNYTALQKYIPALRDAETEEGKQAALNDVLARGYEQQKELLNTTGGAWGAFKGRLGDAMEQIGAVINNNNLVVNGLNWLSEKVKSVSGVMADWVANGGLAQVKAFMLALPEVVRHAFATSLLHIEKWATQAWEFMKLPFAYISDAGKAFVESIKADFGVAVDWIKWAVAKIKGEKVDPPDMTGVREASYNLRSALVGDSEAVRKSMETMREKTAAINDRIEAESNRHTQRMTQIVEQSWKDASDQVQRTKNEMEKGLDSTLIPAAKKSEEIAENTKRTNDAAKELAATTKKAWDDAKKAHGEAEKNLKELVKGAKDAAKALDAAKKALNGMDSKKARENAKAQKEAAKEQQKAAKANEKYVREMERLLDRQKHGGRLSDKQERMLKEYKALVDAEKKAAEVAKGAADAVKIAADAEAAAAANEKLAAGAAADAAKELGKAGDKLPDEIPITGDVPGGEGAGGGSGSIDLPGDGGSGGGGSGSIDLPGGDDSGGAGDNGSIDLPGGGAEWATEATLKELVEYLKGNLEAS